MPAQSGSVFEERGRVVVVGGNDTFGQKLATDALMVAFAVVVGDVLANKMSQMCLAKDDEMIEAVTA